MYRTIAVAFILFAVFALVGQDGRAAPGDLVFERQGEGAAAFLPSMFPHWVHRLRYRCYACHPVLFEMEKGANEVTMDKIKQGQFCGACHNGRLAFSAEFQNCTRCHKAPEE